MEDLERELKVSREQRESYEDEKAELVTQIKTLSASCETLQNKVEKLEAAIEGVTKSSEELTTFLKKSNSEAIKSTAGLNEIFTQNKRDSEKMRGRDEIDGESVVLDNS